MTPGIRKLASQHFADYNNLTSHQIEAFYRAAFNAGLDAAADACDQRATCEGIAQACAEAIRELGMK